MYGQDEYKILNYIKRMLEKGGGGGGGAGDNLKIKTLTQDEYDALVSAGTIDASTFYMIVDEDGE